MASRKTVDEVRARLTGAKRPTASKGTPPRGGKTTGTPRTRDSGGTNGIAPKKKPPTTPDVDLGQRRKPTVSTGTPPVRTKTTGTPKTRGGGYTNGATPSPRRTQTTGTPKTRRPVESPEPNRPQPKPPVVASRAGTPPRGRKVVDPRRKTNPPKKLTVTTGRKKPLRNSRSPFVFEYK